MSRTITRRFGASLGATALLAAGAVALVPSSATAQQACYPPVPQGFNCDGSPMSPSPNPSGGVVSPPASPSASPTGSPSASPATSVAPSTGATSPAASPSNNPPPPGCLVAAEARANRNTIVATGAVNVTVTATPNSIVDLYAYTRPSSTFRVVRSAELGADGTANFLLTPPGNTRMYAQQRGCAFGRSSVINVRTAISIFAKRNGPRNYTFSGDSLPARRGGLIISLYRVTDNGRQVLTAQTRASSTTGDWVINRRFTGSGRFGFVARTGQDLQNAPGSSNVRRTEIF